MEGRGRWRAQHEMILTISPIFKQVWCDSTGSSLLLLALSESSARLSRTNGNENY